MNENWNEKWYDTLKVYPPTGVEVLVELDGCKIANYIKMEFRFGEGLGGYKRWRYLKEGE